MPPQPISTGIWGPLPPNTWGLLLSRSSWTLKGLIVYPGVIDEDYTGEIKIMVSLQQNTITLQPSVPIAQLILLPRLGTDNPSLKAKRGSKGFGSTDAYWLQKITKDKPLLTLSINGKIFQGLIDTGADVSVLTQKQWPSSWPLQDAITPIRGVGLASAPKISSNHLIWKSDDGLSGIFQPFVLDIDLNLWGRDILSEMGLTLETANIPQVFQNQVVKNIMCNMGYEPGKGLGKGLQGNTEPLCYVPKYDRTGLGFSQGH